MQSKHYSYLCVICDLSLGHLRCRIVFPVCFYSCQEFRAGQRGFHSLEPQDFIIVIYEGRGKPYGLNIFTVGSMRGPRISLLLLRLIWMAVFMSGGSSTLSDAETPSPGRCWATCLFDGETDLCTMSPDCIIMIMWQANGKLYEDKCCLQEEEKHTEEL